MRSLVFLALLWQLPTFLGATEYHVAKTGSDQNPGSSERPFVTIQRCASVAQAGDACIVQSGEYYERVSPPYAGAPNNVIAFRAAGKVVMRGFTLRTGYVRVQGFEITDTPNVFPDYYGVYLEGEGYEVLDNFVHHTTADGVACSKYAPSVTQSTIRGNVISYADGTGIRLFGQGNVAEHNDISHTLNASGGDADGVRFFGNGHVMRYNLIHDITEAEAPGAHTDAFQTFDNSHPPSTNILIEGNYCYNLDHQMLMLSAETKRQSARITIRNNIFESPANPTNWQLILVLQIPYVTVVHNTFVNARYRGLYLGDGTTDAVVKNNIFYNVPRYYEIEANSVQGFQVGYNLHYPSGNPSSEPNGLYQDPLFQDITNLDFRLKSGSPAIDRGQDLGVAVDKDGNPRPQGSAPDIGAFEYGAPTPVTLSSLTARADVGAILLEWQTASERDNLGFHVYRSGSEQGIYERITSQLIPGLGSSASGASYQYRDESVTPGTYYYQLVSVSTTGATISHGPVLATLPGEVVPPEEGSPPALVTFGDPAANTLHVIQHKRTRLALELRTSGFYAESAPNGSVSLVVPEFVSTEEPGATMIPVRRIWLDVKPGQRVRVVSVRATDVVALSGLQFSSGASLEKVVQSSQTAGVSFAEGLYPASAARIVGVDSESGATRVLVELAPLRWSETSQQLLWARYLVVRLALE